MQRGGQSRTWEGRADAGESRRGAKGRVPDKGTFETWEPAATWSPAGKEGVRPKRGLRAAPRDRWEPQWTSGRGQSRTAGAWGGEKWGSQCWAESRDNPGRDPGSCGRTCG